MTRSLFFLLCLITGLSTAKASYDITVTVEGYYGTKAYLTSVYMGSTKTLDSANVKAGKFRFKSRKAIPTGLYRIFLNPEKSFDVILDGQPVVISSKMKDFIEFAYVWQGEESRAFYQYLKAVTPLESDMMFLQQTTTDQVKLAVDQKSLMDEKKAVTLAIANAYPNTFTSRLIKSYLLPDPADYPASERKKFPTTMDFLRVHFFDNLNFADTALMNSETFYYAVNYFLGSVVAAKDNENFIWACDVILQKSMASKKMYDFQLKELITTFEKNETIYAYLNEKYVLANEHCTDGNDEEKELLEKKIKLLKYIAIGAEAPPLKLNDMYHVSHDLRDEKGDITVIFFWASWCSHCEQAMPVVVKMYQELKDSGLSVYAVNIDSLASGWEYASMQVKIPFTNVNAYQGETLKAMGYYNVWGTPKFFVLDKNKKIIARPGNVEELNKQIRTWLNKARTS